MKLTLPFWTRKPPPLGESVPVEGVGMLGAALPLIWGDGATGRRGWWGRKRTGGCCGTRR